MDQSPYKEALLRKRGEILAAGGGVKPLQTQMDTNSRQGDLADQASGSVGRAGSISCTKTVKSSEIESVASQVGLRMI